MNRGYFLNKDNSERSGSFENISEINKSFEPIEDFLFNHTSCELSEDEYRVLMKRIANIKKMASECRQRRIDRIEKLKKSLEV